MDVVGVVRSAAIAFVGALWFAVGDCYGEGLQDAPDASQMLVPKVTPNVAVLDFLGDRTVTPEQIRFITGKMVGELMATGAFTVLDRSRMDVILKEQGFQQSGVCTTSECQVQIGQLLGVDYIVAGSLVRFESKYAFRADYIDVATGKVVQVVEQEGLGDLEDVYAPMCRKAAQDLARKVRGKSETDMLLFAVEDAPDSAAFRSAEPKIPADVIPRVDARFLSTKRKVALALWCGSLGGAGFGYWSDAQVGESMKDYDRAYASKDAEGLFSAYDSMDANKTRRNLGYGASAGAALLGLMLWLWPEGGR